MGQRIGLEFGLATVTDLSDYSSCRPFEVHVSINVVVVLPAGSCCRSMIAACGVFIISFSDGLR